MDVTAKISSFFDPTGFNDDPQLAGQKLRDKYQRLRPKKLADASRELPPELISGILYQSRRMLLTGASKSRKSWMLKQIGYCVANGLPFLEKFATVKTKILYVNFELLEAVSSIRFDAMRQELGGDQDNIDVVSASDYLDLIDNDFSEYLAGCAKERDRKCVILDPMWRILGNHDENNNTEVRQALVPLVRFSREASASMIGAHHHTKGSPVSKEAIDRSSGAGAWHRDPAVIFTMTPHRCPQAYTINIVTNDFVGIDPFVVRFNYPLFVIDSGLDPSELKQPPGTKEKTDETSETMLAIIRATDIEGGLGFSEWQKASGVSESTFLRKLKKLLHPHGPIVKSAATGNYMLSPAYAQEWAADTENEGTDH
jgi:hypothetical protein